MLRIASLGVAFGLGLFVATYLRSAPDAPSRSAMIDEMIDESVIEAALVRADEMQHDADEPDVGVPPSSATAVRSAPGAGQKRAVGQVLRALEAPPGDVTADPELAAHLSKKIEEHLLAMQGEQP